VTTPVAGSDQAPTPVREGGPSGFWAVAFAFLVVAGFATLPSPLYGLYRARDGLSPFTITIVYAIFAASTVIALRVVPSIAARLGRRGVMLAAVVTMIVSATLLAAWKDLPGLVVGRLLTGVAVGLVSGTAITYLIELRLRAVPPGSVTAARTVGTSVNVGALGVGPLVAGCLAEWARWPLTLPYLVWIALGVLAVVGLSTASETGAPASTAPTRQGTGSRARLPVAAAVGTLAAFASNGLFAGLSGLLLATTFQHPSHALSGATLFVVFICGVAAQLATVKVSPARTLGLGTASMLLGIVMLVTSVRLSSPSLVLFLMAGGFIGAGAGAVYKGTTGIVLATAAPEDRLAMTSALLIALFIGLSVPVIGAGIALDRGASAPDTVLYFAIVVGVGVLLSGWALLGRRSRPATT
jgi:predicted MFS family arabinose efflux permease